MLNVQLFTFFIFLIALVVRGDPNYFSNYSSLLHTEGSLCLYRTSKSDRAPTHYFNPLHGTCDTCPNGSYVLRTNYVQHTLSPTSLNVLYTLLNEGQHGVTECYCDTSQGLANGNNLTALDAAGKLPPGFVFPPNTSLRALMCVNCTLYNKVPSTVLDRASGAQRCVSCSNGTVFREGRNLTRDLNVTDSWFDPSFPGSCRCKHGYAISEQLGGHRLPVQVCVPCTGTISSRDPSTCIECDFQSQSLTPLFFSLSEISSNHTQCGCAKGYQLMSDGTCEQKLRVEKYVDPFIGKYSWSMIKPLNWMNSGKSGPIHRSAAITDNLALAILHCRAGDNATACSLLANLCLFTFANLKSAPCRAFNDLYNAFKVEGLSRQLPWVFYRHSSAAIISDSRFVPRFHLGQRLHFVISAYSWTGEWIGAEPLVTQLSLCETPSDALSRFYAAGAQRRVVCNINIPHFVFSKDTVFYELFVSRGNANDTLFPVPVVSDYSAALVEPESVFDKRLERLAARAGEPTPGAYQHRFYLYDNVGGRLDNTSAESHLSFVSFAKNVRILFDVRPGRFGRIFVPLLLVQYVSWSTDSFYKQFPSAFTRKGVVLNKTEPFRSGNTLQCAESMHFVGSDIDFNRGLIISLVTLACVCFCGAWVRTYAWMRRRQNLLVDFSTLLRLTYSFCDLLGDVLTVVIIMASIVLCCAYKLAFSVAWSLPADSSYFNAILYLALACKSLVVLLTLMLQVNADVFIVDWERSRGMLMRERKNAPVSMWRSTFVANKLNSLQVLRLWNPLYVMVCVLFFLEGLHFMETWTVTTPRLRVDYDLVGTDSNAILRVAVAGFFWLGTVSLFYVVQYWLYYGLWIVHPLQNFVNLCSVCNISVMILLESQWGYYIHGQSVHQHADVSMEQFQENLLREREGNLPARGLGGQAVCQTFEVFLSTYMRQYMTLCYADLREARETAVSPPGENKGLVTAEEVAEPSKRFSFCRFSPFNQDSKINLTPETLAIKHRINEAWIKSVSSAEEQLLIKYGLHKYFGIPPNILYMNGTVEEGEHGRDLYFYDDPLNYGNFLLYGADRNIFIFYLLLFFTIDIKVRNAFIAMIVCYAVDLAIVFYRRQEGKANMSRKALFDENLLL